jgi:predicted dehydrogenase
VSRLHFLAISRIADARIVALADTYEDLRQKAAEEFHVPQTFQSLSEMLAQADFDVLLLLTPTQFHAEHAALAASKGCTVLVEKPLAPTVQEAQDIILAFRASGARMGVMHSSRYLMHTRAARRMFDDGTLGRALHIDNLAYHGPERKESKDPRFWRFNPGARGHGICMNNLIHYVDMALHVTGQKPVAVHAVIQNIYSQDIAPEDNAHIMVCLDGGAVFTYRYVCGERGCGHRSVLTYYGSRGYLLNSNMWGDSVELHVGRDSQEIKEESASGPDAWHRMHVDFADAMRAGAPLPVTGEQGLTAVAVCEAAYRSAQTGQVARP